MGGLASAENNRKWNAEEKKVANVMSAAFQRCNNPHDIAHCNYGARGIKFEFGSLEAATRWVLDNLGLPPEGTSIDRVNNEGNYAPGNLRWATRTEQNQNKRQYKNALLGFKEAAAARPGLSASQIRILIKRGLSLDEIKAWRKYESSRLRHNQLRSPE